MGDRLPSDEQDQPGMGGAGGPSLRVPAEDLTKVKTLQYPSCKSVRQDKTEDFIIKQS
jgi:hypothetical protein